ncbi:TIGR03746 family integrating conjugative element protein [Aquisalimonas lutea]|uniref:PFL_4703 family integrating conjugative element protein n=1 Tax=Aquisalimonas lutea TaxID=1327750 RepID=UPI0025B2B71E|nr:TIGR03746 family integrating conjugative element protein [Aquisalimonas lutea]MDN3519012.1 TIGR03746 family integrating conjugative element protein [Aquisalimonas lutea]
MRYRKELNNANAHINTLRAIVAVLTVLTIVMWWGWQQAPDDLRVHLTPELRTGGVVEAGEITEPAVYTFALYIWQQIYRWEDNGAEEYGDNIWRLQAFLTPDYRRQLIADMERRAERGELQDRSRAVREIPGRSYDSDRVEQLPDGSWRVWIDVEIREHIDGELVKQVRARYPLRVVRYEVDPESNPWGLALAIEEDNEPERLSTTVEEDG